ncbi:uracil-DNA glycosylase [Homoserinibacter sp. GY 40078]|nr:uracil-DNA glycosylase [Homoserinibacter sp. GY 40078]
MLASEESVQALEAWREEVAARRGVYIPHFDPADAGAEARVLLVMEAPGPMTNANTGLPGSGFISVDNDDQTAGNVWKGRNAVGLHHGMLHWNIVPWYLGVASLKPTDRELEQGGAEAMSLLKLLPNVTVVLLAGEYAQRGWRDYVAPNLDNDPFPIGLPHPSAQSLNRSGARDRFAAALQKAKRRIDP